MKRSLFLLNWLLFFMAFPSGAQVGQLLLAPKPEIPRMETDHVVISHAGYSFLYNEEHEQASWVAYELTREETYNRFKRSNRFKPSPWVSTWTANNADYAPSFYCRNE
jgi:endonuclease G